MRPHPPTPLPPNTFPSRLRRLVRRSVAAAILVLASVSLEGRQQESPPAGAAGDGEGVREEIPWGLPDEMLRRLEASTEAYREFALRFTCTETVRRATYGPDGEASKERVDRYAYFLERNESSDRLAEYRRILGPGGRLGKVVDDPEVFPPAYAWAFLFSRFHQPYFDYRLLGNGFDGFDWVWEIEFRGALPWVDGRDIREWEGVLVLDATTMAPLEIRAEPSGQQARIRALYHRWAQAFNLLGFRLAPRPKGYRCEVSFRFLKEGLRFPTRLRYDTFIAVSPTRTRPVAASIRTYADYQFFKTRAQEAPGRPRPSGPR